MLHENIKQALSARSLLERALYPAADNMVITGQDSAAQADAYAKMLVGKQGEEAVYVISGKELAESFNLTTDRFFMDREAQVYVIHALYAADADNVKKAINEIIDMYEQGAATFVLSGDHDKIMSMIDKEPGMVSRFYSCVVRLDPPAEAAPVAAVPQPKASP